MDAEFEPPPRSRQRWRREGGSALILIAVALLFWANLETFGRSLAVGYSLWIGAFFAWLFEQARPILGGQPGTLKSDGRILFDDGRHGRALGGAPPASRIGSVIAKQATEKRVGGYRDDADRVRYKTHHKDSEVRQIQLAFRRMMTATLVVLGIWFGMLALWRSFGTSGPIRTNIILDDGSLGQELREHE